MKFLEALIKHRFHLLGAGVSYANLIGFVLAGVIFTFWVK